MSLERGEKVEWEQLRSSFACLFAKLLSLHIRTQQKKEQIDTSEEGEKKGEIDMSQEGEK